MRIDALKGSYGVRHRRDGRQGSLFWFEIPYRPDYESANLLSQLNKDSYIETQATNHYEGITRSSTQPRILPARYPSRNKLSPVIESTRDNLNSNIEAPIIPPSPVDTAPDQLCILLADDSPSIMKMISMMLKMKGHQVTPAENGSIALKVLEQQWKSTGRGFDIILMDLQMPVMDGLEATRRIRYLEQSEEKRSIYYAHRQLIVGMSANSDHETMEASYFAGMDDFIVKPFRMDVFLQKLKQLVASSVEQSQNLKRMSSNV
jgi:CheY-like chemotaxis protein